MSAPSWQRLHDLWAQDDGALRDIYVEGTTAEDWQHAVDGLRRTGWPSSYSEDGDDVPMPSNVRDIFGRTASRTCLWQIRPLPDVVINCHFFTESEIECDFDPREIVDERRLEVICDLMRVVGRAVARPVAVAIESSDRPAPAWADMRYEPTADAFFAGAH